MIVAVSECLFSENKGAKLDISKFNDLDLNAILFSESHSRFVVSIKPEDKEKFEKIFKNDATFIGTVTDNGRLQVVYNKTKIIDKNTDEILKNWENGLISALNEG